MAHLPSRRDLFTGASAFTLVCTISPMSASRATVLPPLVTLMGGGAALGAIAQLIEEGISFIRNSAQQVTMGKIADSLTAIVENQDLILQKLAEQRIVVREEVERRHIKEQAGDLLAMLRHFTVALVSDDDTRNSAMKGLTGRAIEKPTKLSIYGLAAVPEYIAAIAFANTVHHVLGVSPQVYDAINRPHREVINLLLNGQSPDSLPVQISQNAREQIFIPPRLRELGRRFPVWRSTIWFKSANDYEGYTRDKAHGLIYQGVKDGIPQLTEYTEELHVRPWPYNDSVAMGRQPVTDRVEVDLYASDALSNGNSSFIPELRRKDPAFYMGVDDQSLLHFTADQISIINRQFNAIRNYYRNLYNPDYGPSINRDTPEQLPPRPAQPTEGQLALQGLLSGALRDINRILLASSRR